VLKSYEAIYDHGHVEWVDVPPRCEHARVLVVLEEPSEVESAPSDASKPNGDWLADIVEQWDIESRVQLVEKFGPPEAWQREQRQERLLPGRGGA
jgi:hypothetical protein